MKKKSLLFILLILAVALFSACSNEGTTEETTDESTQDEVYFAFYGPLTGDNKQYGEAEKIAIEILLEDINEKGNGILGGKKLVVDFFDDKNDAKEAVNIANKIVAEDKYAAVIGGFGTTPTMAALPIYEEAKIPNYTPSASHADLTAQGDYIFRNYLTQAVESKQYADFVYNELGIKSMAIIHVNNDWGNNAAKLFTEEYEALGGVVTDTQTYLPGQTSDFTPMISSAKASNPEAYYPIAFYQDAASILRQSDSLNFEAKKILPSSVLTQALIELGGESVEGAYLMNAFNPDSDSTEFQRVFAEYEKRAGKPGDLYVMLAYDTVKQLATAVDQANSTDGEVVRDTLANMKGFEGLAESYDMNELGDAQRSLFPIVVKDGKFTTYDK